MIVEGMMKDIGVRLALVMVAALAAFLTGYQLGWSPAESVPQAVRIDTLWRVIERPPLYVHGRATVRTVRDTVWAGDTVYVTDTAVYTTPPFVASLDTIVGRDTVSIAYRFPRQEFALALRRAPDSVSYEVRTVTVAEPRSWWEDALYILGGFGAGFIAGSVSR